MLFLGNVFLAHKDVTADEPCSLNLCCDPINTPSNLVYAFGDLRKQCESCHSL